MVRNIKKIIGYIVLLLLVLLGCSDTDNVSDGNTDSSDTEFSFAFVVTGELGDKSFNDSAAAGMEKIENELGYNTDIIEIGSDQTQWEPTILDLSDTGEYTAIFLNGSGTKEIVENIAPDYPNQKYVLFDTEIEEGANDNVFALSYKQNEGSYIGGVVAGLVTISEMEFANDVPKIGFIGGDEDPIINDFLVGYIEGAKSVVPNIEVHVSYVGSWTDTARAKELANAQINEGVDIIFPAAMNAGMGVIEAAYENDVYILGVDSDQASLYSETGDEEIANIILTSVVKEVGESLYLYAQEEAEGNVEYGTTEILGVAEGATGIVDNEYYQNNVPEDIRNEASIAENSIINEEIEVPTALGVESSEVNEIINSVSP